MSPLLLLGKFRPGRLEVLHRSTAHHVLVLAHDQSHRLHDLTRHRGSVVGAGARDPLQSHRSIPLRVGGVVSHACECNARVTPSARPAPPPVVKPAARRAGVLPTTGTDPGSRSRPPHDHRSYEPETAQEGSRQEPRRCRSSRRLRGGHSEGLLLAGLLGKLGFCESLLASSESLGHGGLPALQKERLGLRVQALPSGSGPLSTRPHGGPDGLGTRADG